MLSNAVLYTYLELTPSFNIGAGEPEVCSLDLRSSCICIWCKGLKHVQSRHAVFPNSYLSRHMWIHYKLDSFHAELTFWEQNEKWVDENNIKSQSSKKFVKSPNIYCKPFSTPMNSYLLFVRLHSPSTFVPSTQQFHTTIRHVIFFQPWLFPLRFCRKCTQKMHPTIPCRLTFSTGLERSFFE